MGDFVKGKQLLNYPIEIQQGIRLHRLIDSFTDNHVCIHQAISFFKPHYRLSGGVFVDILFDHFLANDQAHFTDQSLLAFTTNVYTNLNNHEELLTEPMKQLFLHMAKYNWLYHYKYAEAYQRSILGMCKRYPILGEAEHALEISSRHSIALEQLYNDFFPDLQHYVANQSEILKKEF